MTNKNIEKELQELRKNTKEKYNSLTIKKGSYQECLIYGVKDGDTLCIVYKFPKNNEYNLNYRGSLRLSGIEAPEKETEEGEKVKKWLVNRIFKNNKMSPAYIKFEGEDKYGRFLGTVYESYKNKYSKNNYNKTSLNQDMLKDEYLSENLVKPYK